MVLHGVLYDLIMERHQSLVTTGREISVPKRTMVNALRYLFGKALTIAVTIFVGVFITVLIANQPSPHGLYPARSPFEVNLEAQINHRISVLIFNGTIGLNPDGSINQDEADVVRETLRDEAGLNLPYVLRYLLWTFKALTFDWGELTVTYVGKVGLAQVSDSGAHDIVLEHFPNTLLLMGTAYLLVLIIGIPLSLHLARNHGGRLDRLLAILSPISSVPSWIIAILLLAIFAVELRWFPVSGMFDFHRPENPVEYVLVLSKHMVLPVTAIVLSLLFQVIYAWRTFFVIYAEEDYVDLARAKGLPSKTLEKQYILKPALPYVITSFATTLIGFWQLTMALEVIFQWPGLGWLYIKQALPNFWGENMYPGNLMIVVQIVVIFAYLLGILVFLLDLVYVIVDPRIRLLPANHSARVNLRVKQASAKRSVRAEARVKGKGLDHAWQAKGPAAKRGFSWGSLAGSLRESLRDVRQKSGLFFQELRRYPSAIFGLTVIALMLAGSVYAVAALPYEQFGQDYDGKRSTGRSYLPRVAMPEWSNVFHRIPRLSTLVMDKTSQAASVSTRALEGGLVEKTVTFQFEYPYQEVPSEIFLYFDPEYTEKFPFASLMWMCPDGRSVELKRTSVSASSSYDFETGVPVSRLLKQEPAWKEWFVSTGNYPTPAHYLLFAQPGSSGLIPQHGTYRLEIQSLLFEEDSDLHTQLVLLGQVYGLAGTDFWRRDLIVPLLWGMPFTLIIGFLGTLTTTLVAILVPAIGVWFGGWVDDFIQRLSEVNMVLPGLSIAVLMNALFGVNIWIILAVVVAINSLGAPVKTFRSALLQAKEAPYIEAARTYGTSNFRIITRYLVPRILPVLIPQLVIQVPSFIFLEATLGFFNIKSIYPSWGRIIYDGLTKSAIYGSQFWVLEPIALLLLTSLAFAMLGSALERNLNPRMIDTIPVAKDESKRGVSRARIRQRKGFRPSFGRMAFAGLTVVVFLVMIFTLYSTRKTLANAIFNLMLPSSVGEPGETINIATEIIDTPSPIATSSPADLSASVLESVSTPTPLPPTPTISPTPTLLPIATITLSELTLTPSPLVDSRPETYTLQSGEFPYCIARRFDINPNELLALNGLVNQQVFYAGTVLKIPQTGKPFPGDCMLQPHPTTYTVSNLNETIYGIACVFGDIDPVTIAQTNDIPLDSALFVGQQLKIP